MYTYMYMNFNPWHLIVVLFCILSHPVHAHLFQTDVAIAHQYMVQATECLTQAVNLALSKGFKVRSDACVVCQSMLILMQKLIYLPAVRSMQRESELNTL